MDKIIMTVDECIEMLNKEKANAEKFIKDILELNKESITLNINVKESSNLMIDFYSSIIEKCDANLQKLYELKS